jgi:restriction system protein
MSDKLQKDANSINKYEIARTVLVRLNDAGDSALRERREIVKIIVEFNC